MKNMLEVENSTLNLVPVTGDGMVSVSAELSGPGDGTVPSHPEDVEMLVQKLIQSNEKDEPTLSFDELMAVLAELELQARKMNEELTRDLAAAGIDLDKIKWGELIL